MEERVGGLGEKVGGIKPKKTLIDTDNRMEIIKWIDGVAMEKMIKGGYMVMEGSLTWGGEHDTISR